ncbi:unnamed protein product [Boreogadus saida]
MKPLHHVTRAVTNMSAGSMRLNHTTSAAWLRLLLRGQPTCRPALQVRGVSAVQPGTSAPDEAAARDPHAPPLFSRSRTGLFFQAQPQLKNPFLEDPLLGRLLSGELFCLLTLSVPKFFSQSDF